MTLPQDLLAYGKKRIATRVSICGALVAIVATVLALWGDIIFNTDERVLKYSFYLICMLLPFILTGVPHKLIDKTYCGTVKHVHVTTTVDSHSAVRPNQLYHRNNVNLIVETKEGKLLYKTAFSGRAALGQKLCAYKEGDKVFHLYGTDVVLVLPTPADTAVQCAVCGTVNDKALEKCHGCGHSLVKGI